MPYPIRGLEAASRAIRLAAVITAAAALSLAAGSCGVSPLAPVNGAGAGAAIGTGAAAPAAGGIEVPAIGAVAITRAGDRLSFSLEIVPDDEPAVSLVRPGSSAPAPWTFRLYLDTDRDPLTGDEGGADFALMPRPDGRIGLWRRQPSRWEPVDAAPMAWTSSRIAFDLPATALGAGSGPVEYVLDVYASTPVAEGPGRVPAARYAGRGGGTPDERAQVPAISHLRSDVKFGTLILTGNLSQRGSRAEQQYSPYRPGGWCLQVLLNTDQQRTGYWLGFDYIVRGVEWEPTSGASVVRRITLEPGYPGGWGPASGTATLRVSRGSFSIAVPLDAVGGDDGNLDFVLETYATVACPESDSGVSQLYAADYFGSSSAGGRAALAVRREPATSGPERSTPRPSGLVGAGLTPARTPSRP